MTNLTHMAGKELCDALRSGVRGQPSGRGLTQPASTAPAGPAVECTEEAACFTAVPPCPSPAQYCVHVSANGTACVAPSPDDEPLILVPRQWLKPPSFFVPIPAREVTLWGLSSTAAWWPVVTACLRCQGT